jgi:predicted MFS family arabinose efflux permease
MIWVRNTPPGEIWQPPAAADGSVAAILHEWALLAHCALSFWMNGLLLAMQGLWAGPYFSDVYGFDKLAAGNLLLLMAIGAMIGFGSSGWLADRYGLGLVATIGATLQIVGALSLCLPATSGLAIGAQSAFWL